MPKAIRGDKANRPLKTKKIASNSIQCAAVPPADARKKLVACGLLSQNGEVAAVLNHPDTKVFTLIAEWRQAKSSFKVIDKARHQRGALAKTKPSTDEWINAAKRWCDAENRMASAKTMTLDGAWERLVALSEDWKASGGVNSAIYLAVRDLIAVTR